MGSLFRAAGGVPSSRGIQRQSSRRRSIRTGVLPKSGALCEEALRRRCGSRRPAIHSCGHAGPYGIAAGGRPCALEDNFGGSRTVVTVSINIVTFNSEADIAACLESLEQQTFRSYRVRIFDNASADA